MAKRISTKETLVRNGRQEHPDKKVGIVHRRLPMMDVVNRAEFVTSFCAGKRVLHLGAVDRFGSKTGGLHRRITREALAVVGIDNDEDGIRLAKSQGIVNITYGDIESLDEIDLRGFRPDVILASEVIEHLSNPGLFLTSLHRLMNSETDLLITTPNCFAAYRFAYPLLRRETVHQDHVNYYSFSTLFALLRRFEYRVVDIKGYVLPGKLERFARMVGKVFPHYVTGLITAARDTTAESLRSIKSNESAGNAVLSG